MPKSKLSEIISHDDRTEYAKNIVYNISHEMLVRGIKIKDLAKKSAIAESTLRLRLDSPNTFKLGEIISVAEALKMSPYQLIAGKLEYKEEVVK
ncbi:MAG: helix-turn-helix domain-containing protein [Ruminococcus sp.]|nr:helix-turn-helix domain-containing protein [Ruminococcus sp.]